MYLSRLEIQGFKSFANKTSLDFQRGITAVVGPNGSGKSNVADALRWVLGEQSLKLLRGKRSDDVIFAGSDKKSRLGMAEVSLVLNNEDRRAPVDYSEIVITRRVYRNGEGEYLINRQPARLQDIQLLLAQANFGQRTYSVIGQGMIDSFLLSSPQERKHLFDEAAGVRQYQLKREQAVSKLWHSKENLAQGEAIMQEIEPRLRSLTRQVRRLERREELEKELRGKQTTYFGLLWQASSHELHELTTQRDSIEAQRASGANAVAAIQAELEQIERERSASEVFSSLQKNYNQILDEKNTALEQLAKVKGQLEVAAGQAGQMESVFWQKRGQEVNRRLQRLREERELQEVELGRLQTQAKKAEAEHQSLQASYKQIEQRVAAAEAAWQQRLTMSQAKDEVAAWFSKYHALVEALQQDGADMSRLRDQATILQQELRDLVSRLESAAQDGHEDVTTAQQALLRTAQQQQVAAQSALRSESDVRLAEQRFHSLVAEEKKLATEAEQITKDVAVQELAQTNPDEAYAAYAAEAKQLEQAIQHIDGRLSAARDDINNFNTTETEKKSRLFTLQKEFRDAQHHVNIVTAQVNDLQVKIAKVEQRQEDLRREIQQSMGEDGWTIVSAAASNKLEGDTMFLAEEIGHLNHQLQLIGGIDEQVSQEYQETNERWEFLNRQAEDLKAGVVELEKAIGELDKIIKEKFDTAFKKINDEFHQYFRTLFHGGKAELVLLKEAPVAPKVDQDEDDDDDDEDEDEDDDVVATPATPAGEKIITGIEIKATPPGKKLQNIAMLSGGERALTSIALLCAIISNNPSPFVALDEVDAALDEANSQRFAAILEHLAGKTQFITISHNRATMEKAGTLYGVTMGEDGVSQLLSVKMDQVEEIIRKHGNR